MNRIKSVSDLQNNMLVYFLYKLSISYIHCPVPLEIPRGRGVLKVKILGAKYEAKLKFPGGQGVQNKKNFRGRSMDIFWNCTLQFQREIKCDHLCFGE